MVGMASNSQQVSSVRGPKPVHTTVFRVVDVPVSVLPGLTNQR